MKRLLGVAVAAMLIGLVSTPGFTAASSDQRVVHEAVVTQLGPDGSPDSSFVSQLVQLSSKDGSNVELRMPKTADLTSYRNLSGFKRPSGEGKDIVWKTTSSVNAQTLAKIDRKLPFQVHVRYFLNGNEVKPDEVEGKTGRLRMEIELINSSGDPKTLTYKALTSPFLTGTVNQYTPFEYAVRVTFEDHEWDRITGSRFDVAPVGLNQVASATGVLSPPLTGTSDTVSVSAHSSDIKRPEIQVYAFPKINPNLMASLQTQYEALKALYNGTGEISKNLGKLYDGTIQLVDGLEQFAGGTGQLNDGVGKIVAGVGSRDPSTGKPNITLDATGTPTTVIGAIGTISDALTTALLPAIGERDPKTGKAIVTLDSSGTPTTLIGGIGTIADVITGTILPAIGTRDPATGEGVIVKDDLGNTTTLLGGLQSQKDTYDDKLIPGVQTAACGINGVGNFCTNAQKNLNLKSGLVQIKGGASTIDGGLTTLLAQLQTNDPAHPGFREGLLAIQSGLQSVFDGLGGGTATGGSQGLLQVSVGLAKILVALGSDASQPGVAQALAGVNAGLTTLLTNIDGAAGLRVGLTAVSTGLGALVTALNGVVTGLTDLQTETTATRTLYGFLDVGLDTNLADMETKAATLLATLGDVGSPATILGGLQAAKTGVDAALAGIGTSGSPSTTIVGAIQSVNGVIAALVAALGDTATSNTILNGVALAKGGVDQLLAGVGRTARVSTTTALPAYTRVANVVTANANGALASIDGVALALGDRVLLRHGASAADNGVYDVTDLGSAGTPFVLTRSADADSSAEVTSGFFVFVRSGTTLAGTAWQLTTPNPITLNTTGLTFATATTQTLLNGTKAMLTGIAQLIAGLGNSQNPPTAFTIIGVLQLFHGGLGQLIPGLDSEIAGLTQLGVGIHNPDWDKPTAKLGGLTPHQYFKQCPGCFDPTFKAFDKRTADPKFQPGVLEVFHLFSDGIHDALPKLISFDEKNPGLVDGLALIADGLDTIAKKLQTFDPKNPGLVDGIQLIVDGLEKLAQNLQTFDPNHPGLVDGLQLVEDGVKQLDGGAQLLHSGGQQISQGVFAINELGLRTIKGQVGDTGDKVKQDEATIAGAIEDLTHNSTLAKADNVSTTYAFEIPATSTATRDNLIRGGLLALLVALLGLLARRPSLGP